MKSSLLPLFLLPLLGAPLTIAANPPETQAERVGASFLLTLGRLPDPAEMSAWTQPSARPVAELVDRIGHTLLAGRESRRTVAERAWVDAFGQAPTAAELDATSPETVAYHRLVSQHLQKFAAEPAAYLATLQRAYRFVMSRPAYPEEIDYWNARTPLPYVLLVGCIEDWARRNAPGLMVTAGTPTISVNSRHLTTLRLSPGIAAETRAATGLRPTGDPELVAVLGRRVVAPGAGEVVAGGGIHFIAVGNPGLLPNAD